jgi:hypothetical protein
MRMQSLAAAAWNLRRAGGAGEASDQESGDGPSRSRRAISTDAGLRSWPWSRSGDILASEPREADLTFFVATVRPPPIGVVGRLRLGSATRFDAVSDHCAGVLGWMFLLMWNTFSGSYFAFTSASRQ